MILYEAPVMKTVNVNYQLGQLDIGLEKGLFDFYFIPVSVADGSKA